MTDTVLEEVVDAGDQEEPELVADGGTETCPECGSSTFYPNGGPAAYWCEDCELEFWREGGSWFCCGVDGERRAVDDQEREPVADGGRRTSLSPSDLDLSVPGRFETLDVDISDVRVDPAEYDDDVDIDLRDPEDLASERDNALEEARGLCRRVSGSRRPSVLEGIMIEKARSIVVGAMRAEYLRRRVENGSVDVAGSGGRSA